MATNCILPQKAAAEKLADGALYVRFGALPKGGELELRIANLQNMVAGAKVLDSSQLGTDKVQMLNKVKVENLSIGRVMEFTIVGESEADFAKGKLAATTPIAKALMGHSKGEVVDAHVPSGIIKFKILDISI